MRDNVVDARLRERLFTDMSAGPLECIFERAEQRGAVIAAIDTKPRSLSVAPAIRQGILDRLGWLGLTVDQDANAKAGPRLTFPADQPTKEIDFMLYRPGGDFTVADTITGHAVIMSRRLGADFGNYPNLSTYADRLEARRSAVEDDVAGDRTVARRPRCCGRRGRRLLTRRLARWRGRGGVFGIAPSTAKSQ